MTYLLLSAVFLAAAAAVAAAGWRRAPRGHGRAVLAAAAALVVLTAVFDTVMIAVGLFDYRDEHIWGVRIGLAPVEDFAYPIAAVLLLSGLWNLLGPRERTHAD
ncbi:lycopene cyclase domain-containing protein [Agromyces sp. NPDC058136]|uniref:lycopene cyclase domain-containing protein n=1 Tax=Agromyces sp. NPDC058136 TaxID=3346354 RepID=UPI0036DCF1FD